MTQKEVIREVLKDHPQISADQCLALVKEKYNITIQPPVFYSVRSDMGFGSRKNGTPRVSADSIIRVQECLEYIKFDGADIAASTLLCLIDELGFATFRESLKIVATLKK